MPTHCLNLSLQSLFVPCLNIGSKGTVEAHSLNRLKSRRYWKEIKYHYGIPASFRENTGIVGQLGFTSDFLFLNLFVCLYFTFPCKSNTLLFRSCSETFKQKPQLATGEIEGHVNKTVPYLKEVSGRVSEGCTE